MIGHTNRQFGNGQPVELWRPFPVVLLPAALRQFVSESAKSIGCEPALVALPVLSAVASAIGTTRTVRLKPDWSEPAILWTAIVAESGQHKSPATDCATRPLIRRQTDAFKRSASDQATYERELIRHECQMKQWKSKGVKKGDPQPEKPAEPVAIRHVIDDTTIEAVATILESNPRGVLLSCDELASWLGSFNRYRKGVGSDTPRWLSMHSGASILVDRRGVKKTIFVPRAAVSICGGIQPEPLRLALATHVEDGLAPRFLFARPPKRKRVWTDATVPELVRQRIESVFDRLFSLGFVAGSSREPEPIAIELSADAKALWVSFVNEHGAETCEMEGALASCWSKLEAACARLALIFHLVRWASGELGTSDTSPVDAESIHAAATLVNWFGNECRRLYTAFAEDDVARRRRELMELIQGHGGRLSARELMQCCRRFRNSAASAESALEDLRKASLGTWEIVKTGGADRRDFVLKAENFDCGGAGSLSNNGENHPSVTVTGVNRPETEWVEV